MAQTKTKRIDPVNRRMASLAFDPTRLVPETTDPNRVYRFASKTSHNMGVAQRLSLGWVIETVRKDGPRMAIGTIAKDGEPMEYKDVVLMSIERDRWEEAERVGWYGEAGQELVDQFSRRVRKNGNPEGPGSMPRVANVSVRSLVDQDAYQE